MGFGVLDGMDRDSAGYFKSGIRWYELKFFFNLIDDRLFFNEVVEKW